MAPYRAALQRIREEERNMVSGPVDPSVHPEDADADTVVEEEEEDTEDMDEDEDEEEEDEADGDGEAESLEDPGEEPNPEAIPMPPADSPAH